MCECVCVSGEACECQLGSIVCVGIIAYSLTYNGCTCIHTHCVSRDNNLQNTDYTSDD